MCNPIERRLASRYRYLCTAVNPIVQLNVHLTSSPCNPCSVLTYHYYLVYIFDLSRSFNWFVAEYLKKLSSFDFHDVHAIGRLLVLLTSAWPSDRTSAFFPALFARWKTTLLQNRGCALYPSHLGCCYYIHGQLYLSSYMLPWVPILFNTTMPSNGIKDEMLNYMRWGWEGGCGWRKLVGGKSYECV